MIDLYMLVAREEEVFVYLSPIAKEEGDLVTITTLNRKIFGSKGYRWEIDGASLLEMEERIGHGNGFPECPLRCFETL